MGVRAQSMRQVMIDVTKARLAGAKDAAVGRRSGLLVPHAGEGARRVEHIQVGHRPAAGGVELQIMAKYGAGRLPAEAYFVDLGRPDLGEIEAGLYGQLRKTGVVLQARDSFFGNREKQLCVAHNTCGRVMHLRIVDPQCQHSVVFIPDSAREITARTRYVRALPSPLRTQPSASKQRRSLHCLAKSVPGNTAKLGCCAVLEAVPRIKIQSR